MGHQGVVTYFCAIHVFCKTRSADGFQKGLQKGWVRGERFLFAYHNDSGYFCSVLWINLLFKIPFWIS
jgi:hypothetical protein